LEMQSFLNEMIKKNYFIAFLRISLAEVRVFI